MRDYVVKSSVLVKLVNPLLLAILILSGTVTAMSIPLTSYAQSDRDYDLGTDSSDVSTYDDMAMDEGQNDVDESSEATDSNDGTVAMDDFNQLSTGSEASDSNDGTVAMDDFNQVSTDASAIDKGVNGNQSNTDSSSDNFPTDNKQDSDPIADAGQDLEADENSDVRLDGSGSLHEGGEIFSYSWEQTDGYPLVELNDAGSAQPSFTAPDVDSNQELTFRLIVTDNDGLTDTDSVTVLVKDINQAEVAEDSVEPVPGEQDKQPSPAAEVPDANTTDCEEFTGPK